MTNNQLEKYVVITEIINIFLNSKDYFIFILNVMKIHAGLVVVFAILFIWIQFLNKESFLR